MLTSILRTRSALQIPKAIDYLSGKLDALGRERSMHRLVHGDPAFFLEASRLLKFPVVAGEFVFSVSPLDSPRVGFDACFNNSLRRLVAFHFLGRSREDPYLVYEHDREGGHRHFHMLYLLRDLHTAHLVKGPLNTPIIRQTICRLENALNGYVDPDDPPQFRAFRVFRVHDQVTAEAKEAIYELAAAMVSEEDITPAEMIALGKIRGRRYRFDGEHLHLATSSGTEMRLTTRRFARAFIPTPPNLKRKVLPIDRGPLVPGPSANEELSTFIQQMQAQALRTARLTSLNNTRAPFVYWFAGANTTDRRSSSLFEHRQEAIQTLAERVALERLVELLREYSPLGHDILHPSRLVTSFGLERPLPLDVQDMIEEYIEGDWAPRKPLAAKTSAPPPAVTVSVPRSHLPAVTMPVSPASIAPPPPKEETTPTIPFDPPLPGAPLIFIRPPRKPPERRPTPPRSMDMDIWP